MRDGGLDPCYIKQTLLNLEWAAGVVLEKNEKKREGEGGGDVLCILVNSA